MSTKVRDRIRRELIKFAEQHHTAITPREIHLMAGVAADAAGRVDLPEHIQSVGETLTSRQRMLLRMVAGGLSDQEISRRAAVAVPTVQREIDKIVQRLGAVNRPHAVAVAFARGLLKTGQIRIPDVQVYAKPGPKAGVA